MKNNSNVDGNSVGKSGFQTNDYSTNGDPMRDPQGRPEFQTNGHAPAHVFNIWVVLDLLAQRWHWLVICSAVAGGCFYLLGWHLVKPKFTAWGQLLRYEAPGKSEYFRTAPVSAETFVAMIRSPELLADVGSKAVPVIPGETLNKIIKIDPEADSDMVKVQVAARDPQQAVNVLNLYLTNAVEFTRRNEARQAALLANEYLKKEVSQMDQDISDLQEQLRKIPLAPLLANGLARVGQQVTSVGTNLTASQQPSMVGFARHAERLQNALSELNDLMLKYTDLHPAVQQKRQLIRELETQIAQSSTNGSLPTASLGVAAPMMTSGGVNPDLDIIHIKMRALQDGRVELSRRQLEADLYAKNPPGTVKVFAPASQHTVKTNLRRFKIAVFTIFGACLGLGASIGLVFLIELVDNRLKTADDVTRVTRLPVLTTLGDLRSMKPHDRTQWGFKTWTMLQGRLSPSANFGLVCGITSSKPGEGRSTCITLLAEAASMTGFRVLTIATRPSASDTDSSKDLFQEARPHSDESNQTASSGNALTTSVLASPSQVTDRLTGPNSQPMVHIPLPGWVWNLDRRKQWREALDQWRRIDNLVILVELPPASVPEAVLLGSNLPNLLWLADSGKPNAAETRDQMEMLRHARCNLVGAILNRQVTTPLRNLFPRWISGLALLTFLGVANTQGAAVPPADTQLTPDAPLASPNDEAHTNLTFSILRPSQRAVWQQHLSLGPGDVLTFNLYGQPELARPEVAIGPDGRVSYLEAQDILATGLTVDELRAKMDEELAKYRRAPRTIITPVAFHSKKYYMLGKVTTKGVFTLDRPLTVLEAIARAHGLENALIDRNMVSLTDFQHSFLARGGKRISLNFEKLFQQGDLSQNIAIEPGDYIYFAAGDINEVYVVGEVRLPGPVTFTPDLTIIGAITGRGGYSDRAFKTRVLVIRGPLAKPLTFAVNTHAILDAKAQDFKLEPKDIIFVNSRPFIKVEEAADLAVTAFIQSVITSWVGVDVVKPIQ